MSLDGWLIFAGFWVVFVTSPGPNAANCIQNGMTYGFARALWGVAGILTQALLFLTLSALGVTALIATSPTAFTVAKFAGATLLIWFGLRAWMRAHQPIAPIAASSHIYSRAFAIATLNPKSVAGYLAAFSQFVQTDVPIAQQMWVIVPTALTITAASYASYTALGAWLGRRALSAVANTTIRRVLAGCFILYGLALGAASFPERT
ncbi:LysE family translocator [Tropicibacter naphthalenivorans]|uniref:Homoserine/homoserine lactone efflux protein n=1 Tax=Tropicibacter naphthalenivorans TaxID=441103 RepID=A0A0P1G1H0_9RHOB|nr:LysE family translocator [Tropicibacter naphthalenivorans]CUH75532.1 Homoserine/homoserine lactone efflux protein [Tropicibacter naphthalenivorans]SMC43874.1 Threonine/homoserine/homoserine lactone efflux protein [Tropicibacter naphthalenivorans]